MGHRVLAARAVLFSTLSAFTITTFQNCSQQFQVQPDVDLSSTLGSGTPQAVSCTLPNGTTIQQGESVTGFAMMSVLSPMTCGSQVTRTCLSDGQFDGAVPVHTNCIQQCLHPDNNQAVNAGAQYTYFTKATGASQAECDAARVVSSCQQATGLFAPAVPATRFNACTVQVPMCAYNVVAGTSAPTGNVAGSTVTGFQTQSATYPALCGANVTHTCQTSSQWSGAVPLYTACTQQCRHPDNNNAVNANTQYTYFTRATGATQAECDAARVVSSCSQTTGLFAPAVAATRYASCLVQGQTCAYSAVAGTAAPTGNMTGATVTGFTSQTATSPNLCGVSVTRTCQASGQWTGTTPLYTACTQQCIHPDNNQAVNAGSQYIFFTKANGATQAECDAARVVSSCSQTTGAFAPAVAATRYNACTVQTPMCAYNVVAGTATPTGTTAGSTVTGFATQSATYPALCGQTVTRTCQTSSQWNGAVPVYTACSQKCVHPDTAQPVDAQTQYVYFTRASGTQAECTAARVASTCSQATGLFAPVPAATRFATCQIVTPPPPPPPPATGGLSCDAQAITCVEVVSGTSQASLSFTFGQPFKQGNLMGTQGLAARDSSGNSIPLQMDEVVNHVDGSIKLAVLSLKVPNVVANQARIINLYSAAKTTAQGVVPANPNWNLEVEVKLYNGNTVTATLLGQAQELLKTQIANSQKRRLAGAVANEYIVQLPLKNTTTNQDHAHLTAHLHTRFYEDGSVIRTDVVMENNWTFKAGPASITYDMTIKQNGQVVHTQPKFTHYHHARWHKVVWSGSQPNYRMRYNMPYFLQSKIVHNYNLNLKIPESVLVDEARALASANTKPMGNAFLTTYFPQTGARPELAPLPRWAVLYLLTQDDRARNSLLANGDAAAGVPIHYRDENTGYVVSVQQHPNLSVRYPDSSQPKVAEGTGSVGEWEADRAHQGSFAFLPYIATGDLFYLEEAQFWATWNMAWSDPNTRGGALGLITLEQMRGQAWGIRTLADAHFITPESHPLKSNFKAAVRGNLDYFHSVYSSPATMSPLGAMGVDFEREVAIPWQNDFMATTFARLAENKEPKSKEIMDIVSKFNVGRFMNEANGFCPSRAATYDMAIVNNSGKYITTWSELYKLKYPELVGQSCSQVGMNEEAYPDDPLGMSAHARGALAAAATLGIPQALEAYNKWKALTPALDEELIYQPAWAIVP